MCKYCENNIEILKSSKSGYYKIANSFQIKNKKLLLHTEIQRKTSADEYYESCGIESVGELKSSTKTFDIKFCPFCGKKLVEEYKQKIFVFVSDKGKDNDFVKDIPWLIEEFNYLRKREHDISSDSFYLRYKIQKTIKQYVETTKNAIGLKDGIFIPSGLQGKTPISEFREIIEFLNSGYDVFNSIDCNYKYLEQVIEKLKKFKYDVIIFNIDSIKIDNENQKIEITPVFDLLMSNKKM